jgi:hypothetical protein
MAQLEFSFDVDVVDFTEWLDENLSYEYADFDGGF